MLSVANLEVLCESEVLETSNLTREQLAAFRLLREDPTALPRVKATKTRKAENHLRSCVLAMQLHVRLFCFGWTARENVPVDLVWAVVCDLLQFWWTSTWSWADDEEAEEYQKQSVQLALEWPNRLRKFVEELSGMFVH